jgi:hypothetical protein
VQAHSQLSELRLPQILQYLKMLLDTTIRVMALALQLVPVRCRRKWVTLWRNFACFVHSASTQCIFAIHQLSSKGACINLQSTSGKLFSLLGQTFPGSKSPSIAAITCCRSKLQSICPPSLRILLVDISGTHPLADYCAPDSCTRCLVGPPNVCMYP